MIGDAGAWYDFFGPDYDDGSPSVGADMLAEEHRVEDVPALTALFHRSFPTYTEVMWIHGYPSIRSIVVAHPAAGGQAGCIRTIPVGWRDMLSAETFRAKFERVVAQVATHGWERKSHAVPSADPRGVASVLDDEPNL